MFDDTRDSIGLPLNYNPHIIIKGASICGVIWPDVRDSMVAEIAWLPCAGFHACVQSQNAESSSICLLHTGQHYFPLVEFEAIWQDEWRHNVAVTEEEALYWLQC